jgi:hypothetical protein
MRQLIQSADNLWTEIPGTDLIPVEDGTGCLIAQSCGAADAETVPDDAGTHA